MPMAGFPLSKSRTYLVDALPGIRDKALHGELGRRLQVSLLERQAIEVDFTGTMFPKQRRNDFKHRLLIKVVTDAAEQRGATLQSFVQRGYCFTLFWYSAQACGTCPSE